jgi:3-isopropylmalate dehydrogenase
MSLAMLLEHVGEQGAAAWVESAVAGDLAARGVGTRSTSEIGDALADAALAASKG